MNQINQLQNSLSQLRQNFNTINNHLNQLNQVINQSFQQVDTSVRLTGQLTQQSSFSPQQNMGSTTTSGYSSWGQQSPSMNRSQYQRSSQSKGGPQFNTMQRDERIGSSYYNMKGTPGNMGSQYQGGSQNLSY
ncbi:MAG: hypothetical protein ACQEQF_02580 [Bacillota bacterium]